MDIGIVQPGELRYVAPHVATAGVVATCLQHHVVGPVESGIGPGPSHPLPVHRVVGRVAVDQEVGEVLRTEPPVDVQRLAQEVRHDQPRPVVHPALPGQLAHPGVDDRVSGAALLPGRQLLGVLVPLIAARAVVGAHRVRPGG
jgi:hypothetical protein